jgi:hypothetical protein
MRLCSFLWSRSIVDSVEPIALNWYVLVEGKMLVENVGERLGDRPEFGAVVEILRFLPIVKTR